MSDENNDPELQAWIDPELEARVVAWVLGEASDFEAAELARIIAEKPELGHFKRRIEAVHGLVAAASRIEMDPMRLEDERRRKLLEKLGGNAISETGVVAMPGERRQTQFRFWVVALGGFAACLVIGVLLLSITGYATKMGSLGVLGSSGIADPRDNHLGAALFMRATTLPQSFATAAPTAPERLAALDSLKALASRSSDGEEASAPVSKSGFMEGEADLKEAEQTMAKRSAKDKAVKDDLVTERNETIASDSVAQDQFAAAQPATAPAQLQQQLRVQNGQTVVMGRLQMATAEKAWAGAEAASAPEVAEAGQAQAPQEAAATPQERISGNIEALRATQAPIFEARAETMPHQAEQQASQQLQEAANGLNTDASGGVAADAPGPTDATVALNGVNSYTGATISHSVSNINGGRAGGAVFRAASAGDEVAAAQAAQVAPAATAEAQQSHQSEALEDKAESIAAEVPASPSGPLPSQDLARLDADDTTSRSNGTADILKKSTAPELAPSLKPQFQYSLAAGASSVSLSSPALGDVPLAGYAFKASGPQMPLLRDEVRATDQPYSTFSLHVSDVSFLLARAALAQGETPDRDSIRAEEFYNAFDYGDPAPAPGEKIACRIEQAAHPMLQQRNLVRIAMKVAATGRGQGQPLRLTVLLDTSGSMEREDRAASVRRAMQVLTSLLGPNDAVTLIGFARQPRLLAEEVPGDQAGKLVDFVAHTPAEGGTNMEEAIKVASELALRHLEAGGQNRVVMLTDGAANLGDADPVHLSKLVERLRQQGVSFDACGVGADGLNDDILEALTRKGGGRYYFVNKPEDADDGFARQLAGAFRPAAENVKMQVRFNPARVGKYRLIGFEKHRLNQEDFRNDQVTAAQLAAEEAAVALYQVQVLPEGEGEIGEVFVRFRDPVDGRMVEQSWTIPYDAQAPALDKASPSMQLAATASLLAEKLRGGAVADAVDMAALEPIVAQVRGHYAQQVRVQDLVAMFEQVRRMTERK